MSGFDILWAPASSRSLLLSSNAVPTAVNIRLKPIIGDIRVLARAPALEAANAAARWSVCVAVLLKSLPLGLSIVSLIEPLHAPPRFNGAPGQEQWVIRQNPKTGERTLERLWWGLIPRWVKDAVGT